MASPLPNAVANLVNTLDKDAMKQVNSRHLLENISPWGFAPADVHFIIVAAGKHTPLPLSLARSLTS